MIELISGTSKTLFWFKYDVQGITYAQRAKQEWGADILQLIY